MRTEVLAAEVWLDSGQPVDDVDDRHNPILLDLLREWGWVWCARCYMAHSFEQWSAEWISNEVQQDIQREPRSTWLKHRVTERIREDMARESSEDALRRITGSTY